MKWAKGTVWATVERINKEGIAGALDFRDDRHCR